MLGAVQRFDDAVERRLDRARGHRGLDRLFYTASRVAEFSLIWHVLNVVLLLVPDRELMTAVRIAVILMAEGFLVNGVIKQLFRRTRPVWTRTEERPHHLRIPVTSSFPSGHASAAFCAALLFTGEGPGWWPLWYGLAVVVASSRCWVRIHHASDVVGGAVVGTLLGLLANAVWPPT